MKQKVFLIGGTYGSGKTTIAELIQNDPNNEFRTAVVDYDLLIGNSRGRDVDISSINDKRRRVWGEEFFDEIHKKISEGSELILAPGTFGTRERREKYLHGLVEATKGMIDVIPLYFMLPMKQTISDIKSSRTDETHLVNHRRVHGKYREFNQSFRTEDHSDLLLPSDRYMLSPEHRALLSKHEHNKHLLDTPHEDAIHPHRQWVVLTTRIDPSHALELVRQDLKFPLEIRAHFERDHARVGVEENGLFSFHNKKVEAGHSHQRGFNK